MKTEVQGMYKESEGIIINKDNAALQAYKKRKQIAIDTKNEMASLHTKIDEIKELLIRILNK